MALLDRVATLIRANLNDLIDQAEDPEKMLKQVILDMQNQLLQVKTQVAIAIADHHLLLKKKKEHDEKTAEWKRKAELAVDKKDDALARAAIDRALTFDRMARSLDLQIADQSVQVENLKSALHKLEGKLDEAKHKSELLISQHRRARAINRAGDARMKLEGDPNGAAFDRLNQKVQREEAFGLAKAEMLQESVDDQFAKLEKADEVERVLAEIKARKAG
jgi:phage shock protein A